MLTLCAWVCHWVCVCVCGVTTYMGSLAWPASFLLFLFCCRLTCECVSGCVTMCVWGYVCGCVCGWVWVCHYMWGSHCVFVHTRVHGCVRTSTGTDPDRPCSYFCSNSLGLMPKSVRGMMQEELDKWATK